MFMKLAHWQRGCTGQNYTVDEISDGDSNRESRAAVKLCYEFIFATVARYCQMGV